MFVFTFNVPHASDQHPGDNQTIHSMKMCPLNLKLFKYFYFLQLEAKQQWEWNTQIAINQGYTLFIYACWTLSKSQVHLLK